jgi:hypothetical protein
MIMTIEEVLLCPFCGKEHPVVTCTPIIRDKDFNEGYGEPYRVVLLDCAKREPVKLDLFNTRPIEDSLRDEIELFRQTLVDNEAYCLDVARQRDLAIADADRLSNSLSNMLILIHEHGNRIMLAHATRRANASVAVYRHMNLKRQQTR